MKYATVEILAPVMIGGKLFAPSANKRVRHFYDLPVSILPNSNVQVIQTFMKMVPA